MEAEIKKIYGPYTAKDGRQRVFITYKNGRKRTVSYPKWLKEQELGRELDPVKETIDHINRDFTDNTPDNLRIIPISLHVQEDVKRVKLIVLSCIYCGEQTKPRSPRFARRAAKNNKAGPFCSKRCSGKYGAELQNGRQKRLDAQNPIDSEYYILKKSNDHE